MIADIIHGEIFDITFTDVLEFRRKCNKTIDEQLAKVHDFEPHPNIQGESQFQDAIDEYLAQGKIVKRYPCMIVDHVEGEDETF